MILEEKGKRLCLVATIGLSTILEVMLSGSSVIPWIGARLGLLAVLLA